jgi:hypothetical protein
MMGFKRDKVFNFSFENMTVRGDIAEFGVFKGETAEYIHEHLPNRSLHLFDSFKGLPEDWRDHFKKGFFGLKRVPLKVRGLSRKRNVHLYNGVFKDTVPAFVKTISGPLAFIHIDCDVYSSTRDVFFNVNELLTPGTVVQFDEYYNYTGFELHEYRAFIEWKRNFKRDFEYIGRSNLNIVIVRILK